MKYKQLKLNKIMRLHKDKEQFFSRLKKEIFVINELLEFHKNVYLPTVEKFNGKVYNKRFINALKEQCNNELMLIRDRERDEIVIELRFEKHNYTDCKRMYCKLLLNSDYRIDYNATINDDLGNKWIGNLSTEIEDLQSVMNNFDNYLQVANECQEVISKFAELPYQFRNNIVMDQIWYLK